MTGTLLILFAGACSTRSSETVDAVDHAIRAIDVAEGQRAVLTDRDFASVDLYFLQLEGNGNIHRLDASTGHGEPLLPPDGHDLIALSALQASADHRGLYARTVEADASPPPPIEQVEIRQVRVLKSDPDLIFGPPLIATDNGACVGEAGRTRNADGPDGLIGFTAYDEPLSDTPLSGTWRSLDSDGTVRDQHELPVHVLCPTRASDVDTWSWAEPGDPEFLTTLVIEAEGRREVIAWPGCVLAPSEFNAAGSRLAMAATCSDDPTRTGLWIVDVATLEPESNEPLLRGRVGPVRWSPSERMLAIGWLEADSPETSVQVSILRLDDGARYDVPTPNTSWPAWVLKSDPDGQVRSASPQTQSG